MFGGAAPPHGLIVSRGSDTDGSAFSLGSASDDDQPGGHAHHMASGVNDDDERPKAGLLRPGAIHSDGPLAEDR